MTIRTVKEMYRMTWQNKGQKCLVRTASKQPSLVAIHDHCLTCSTFFCCTAFSVQHILITLHEFLNFYNFVIKIKCYLQVKMHLLIALLHWLLQLLIVSHCPASSVLMSSVLYSIISQCYCALFVASPAELMLLWEIPWYLWGVAYGKV